MKDLLRANEAVDQITQVFKLQNEWRAHSLRQINDLTTIIIAQRLLIRKLSQDGQVTSDDYSERLIELAQKVAVMTADSVESLQHEALDILIQISILGRK